MKTNVRRLALDLLCRIEKNGSYSNISIDTVIRSTEMCKNDRSLFTALVYGVIERRLTLDYYINSLSHLSPEKIEPLTRNILRIGIYQLIYLDRIPQRAVINETVSLCKKSSAGFVNALLRRITSPSQTGQEKPVLSLPPLPPREGKPYRYLSLTYSFPLPLCRKLVSIFGFERTEQLLSAFCQRKSVTLRVNTLVNTREELIDKLGESGVRAERGRICDTAIKITAGSIPAAAPKPTQGSGNFFGGDCRFFVQDEASQLCVKILGAKPGETVLDLCAAPGSKSFGIAAEMENRGKIMSFDLHSSKLSLIENGASRLRINIITAIAADTSVFIPSLAGVADRVLCDVPCSGFGVCGKKPEIKYKSLEECASLPDLQLKIAENAAKYLKAGGIMVYSTCTLLPEENELNIQRLLAEHTELEPLPFSVTENGINLEAENGMLTLTPEQYGTDGFFIAKLRKRPGAKEE